MSLIWYLEHTEPDEIDWDWVYKLERESEMWRQYIASIEREIINGKTNRQK